MQSNSPLEGTLRMYVLGELDETARLVIEEQVVTTPEVYEALALAEQALIDEYLDEGLSAVERASFERRMKALPPLRQKVRFARRLRARAAGAWAVGPDGVPGAQAELTGAVLPPGGAITRRRTMSWAYHPAWAASVAAALVILVGGAGWWATNGNRQGELERLRAQHQQDRRDIDRLGAAVGDLQAQVAAAAVERAKALPAHERPVSLGLAVASEPAGPRAAIPPTFVLATGLVRSAGSLPRVAIPEGTLAVRLRLPVPEIERAEFRALLSDADGNERLAVSGLRASGSPPVVTVTVAAESLPRGDYELQLVGAEPGPPLTYPFRVTSR